MAHLVGLFERGGSYYLRVVLPQHHHLRSHYRSGKVVLSLGKCSYRDASRIGTQKRAEVLWGGKSPSLVPTGQVEAQPSQHQIPTLTGVKPPLSLRKVFELWIKSSPKSADAIAACARALKLFEEHTANWGLMPRLKLHTPCLSMQQGYISNLAQVHSGRHWLAGLRKWRRHCCKLLFGSRYFSR